MDRLGYGERVIRGGWARLLLVAVGVGILALLSNITSIAQLSGQADTWLTVRFTLSKLVNSGTVWAGLLVLGGWFVPRLRWAWLAGTLAGLVALVVHYGLGLAFGMFESTVWGENRAWFVASVLFGPLLGTVGAIARRTDVSGLLARLVVPVGAVVEPLLLGMLTPLALLPAPDRISSMVAGGMLLVVGTVGAAIVVRRWKRDPTRRHLMTVTS